MSMIFNLGKKEQTDRPVEQETLNRWRSIASRAAEEKAGDSLSEKPSRLERKEKSWEVGGSIEAAIDTPVPGGSSLAASSLPGTTTLASTSRSASPVNSGVGSGLGAQEKLPPLMTSTRENASTYLSRSPAGDASLPVDEDLHRRFGLKLRSALGAGAVMEGKLSFETPVRIDGSLFGEVTSTSTLIVGEQGVVKAQIKVGSLIVLGCVTGKVEALDLVEIKAGGRLEADIRTKRIVIENGGFFEGECKISRESE